ncbi:MAG: ABC transporter permease [Planctomycetota bacterium]
MAPGSPKPQPLPAHLLGGIGRWTLGLGPGSLRLLGVIGQNWQLFTATLYWSFVAPLNPKQPTRLRSQLFGMMTNVGVRSAPIVCLVALLVGAILVLQTGETIDRFGQIEEGPGLVALSMTRALGPLMTAIVLISRVGASYTAVLGSMNINDEITALETMSINPIGYLVAPRFLSMLVMTPCLVVFAYLLGMTGGAVVAYPVYDIPFSRYAAKSFEYLTMPDLFAGIIKASVFGVLISIVSCYYGLTSRGGPTGLGRNIMVSVVTCLVVIVFADAILTALINNYLF